MPQQTPLDTSVVIPCYNEESNIVRCLEALNNQTLKPLEIIIVDNNCTDRTIELAKTYPGVRIVREAAQGLIAARNRGIRVARGSVIARIDADSAPAPQWLAEVSKALADPAIVAVSGTGYFYDFPFRRLTRGLRNLFAVHLNRLLLGHHMLWGSNMALRANAWHYILPNLCVESDLMEDMDVAMHLADEFGPQAIAYVPAMRADISIRRGSGGLAQNFRYLAMWPRTLRRHRFFAAYITWPVVALMLTTGQPLVGTIVRFYDGDKKVWSLNHRRRAYLRDNP